MKKLDEILEGVQTVAIAGHVNPDGDCIGSAMGVYLYLRDNFSQIQADVYLEGKKHGFEFIPEISSARTEIRKEWIYDLLILVDVSSTDRVALAGEYIATAKKTVCIDHHVTNTGFCMENHVIPDASSTCEVLYDLMDHEKISRECATALYTGIVTDTGIFQYSNTTPHTMRVAASLLEKDIPFSDIVEQAFYRKTYAQNQLMGRTLMESIMLLNGKCIVGIVRQKEMKFYGLTPADMDGIVNQLRYTEGVEVAIFLYELAPQTFKVSMRSDKKVDVSKIANLFGGGGHIRAAGCTMNGSPFDVINNLTLYIEKQLLESDGE
ncbi:MAG TPA: bifunctional oligoribonuclease/PAP phosphatase NrnA [Candidatus Fusicatenibacter merdavium]|uniref:Bifunctional oligoribonuclease/PAP phosphatase NrnA n=1 Tax=Candidatus Fusicatenibacter merdavium TaxID=2838600 RepID=A0A9D1XC51_9FIRM|nr:bifunctional oligoribonuclease/PAP phosphatase NrnA [Candidatus Fusicatenibacter merdavium]